MNSTSKTWIRLTSTSSNQSKKLEDQTFFKSWRCTLSTSLSFNLSTNRVKWHNSWMKSRAPISRIISTTMIYMERMSCRWLSSCLQPVDCMTRFNLTSLMLLVFFWQLFAMILGMMGIIMAIMLIQFREEQSVVMMCQFKKLSMLLNFSGS